jgi:hypothetical protein
MTSSYRRILVLIILTLLSGCSAVRVLNTPVIPTPTPTIPLTSVVTISPFPGPTPSFTETTHLLITISPTRRLTPTIEPTNSTPCEADYECVISKDRKWAADGYGKMFPGGIYAQDYPFLRIYRADGVLVQKIFYLEKATYGDHLMYLPSHFDRTNQWLYASLHRDGFFDAPNYIFPEIFGYIKINVVTGQVVPMVGRGSYYSVSFSPDESLFAYTMNQTLGILNLKSGQRNIIAMKYTAAKHITWNPDGSRFLVAASKDAIKTENWDILLITPGDSQPVQILDSTASFSKAIDYINSKSW